MNISTEPVFNQQFQRQSDEEEACPHLLMSPFIDAGLYNSRHEETESRVARSKKNRSSGRQVTFRQRVSIIEEATRQVTFRRRVSVIEEDTLEESCGKKKNSPKHHTKSDTLAIPKTIIDSGRQNSHSTATTQRHTDFSSSLSEDESFSLHLSQHSAAEEPSFHEEDPTSPHWTIQSVKENTEKCETPWFRIFNGNGKHNYMMLEGSEVFHAIQAIASKIDEDALVCVHFTCPDVRTYLTPTQALAYIRLKTNIATEKNQHSDDGNDPTERSLDVIAPLIKDFVDRNNSESSQFHRSTTFEGVQVSEI